MSEDETRQRRSSVLIRPLVFLALLLVIVVGGIHAGISFLSRRSQKVGLEVSSDSLHFGQAWVQKAFRWRLSVENPTNKEVRVREIRSSCHCASVNPMSLVMAPGSQTEVELVFDLSPRSFDDYREASWPFKTEVALITEGGVLAAASLVNYRASTKPLWYRPGKPAVHY